MPDIMMCDAENCPKAATCYRHVASGTKADEYYQCYWLRDETSPVGDGCTNYWRRTPLVAWAHDGSMP